MAEENRTPHKLLKLSEVCQRTTLSRAVVNGLRRSGDFPRAVQIAAKRIAFVEAEIDAWITDRVERNRVEIGNGEAS